MYLWFDLCLHDRNETNNTTKMKNETSSFARCRRNGWMLVLVCLCGLCSMVNAQPANGQRKQLFDAGWKFMLGDEADAKTPGYNDATWRTLDLPHDWSIEGTVDAKAPAGNDGGYYPTGIGWYRKAFTLSPKELKDKKIGIYFEGVYMNSEVFLNGKSVGMRPYGYSSFFYDLTPYMQEGTNVLAVRVDNAQQKNCRWYSGSGIYRHVWLTTTNLVHVDHWGVAITTPEVSKEKAQVQVKTLLKNESSTVRQITLTTRLTKAGQASGQEETTVELPANGVKELTQTISVSQPELWSPETPHLYDASLTVTESGRLQDQVTETFGIRSICYSAEKGFVLNGQKTVLNGGCLHHDNGCLGAAAYDRAEERKAELLKNAGFNAVRTSHNLPSEAFLSACDRIGLLVIDEAFDGWRDQKTPYDYSTLIDQWWKQDIEAMVLRDRNHPSIFCWSTGNEIIERKKLEVVTTARKLADHIRRFDSTRPITNALAAWDSDWEIYDPLAAVHEIVGYNYMIHKAESDHERVPARVMMQTESYPRDAFSNWTKVNDNAYVIGDFVWTAMDYLGESGIGRYYYEGESEGEHYHRDQYPWHGAYCGDIDLTGWRKPISHYRDLLYNAEKKLYLAVKEPNGYYGKIKETQWSVYPTWESWNWPGHEGKQIEVEIYSRYPQVRLYLNDRLIGEQLTGRDQQFKAVFPLPYEAGVLKAVGVQGGQEEETTLLQTAGKAATIRLTADRTQLKADGQDLSFITIEILDKNGVIEPNATNLLTFDVKGTGSIAAVGNADLQDKDSYVGSQRKAWKGRALVVVKSTPKAGKTTLKVSSPGLTPATLTLYSKK